MVVASQVHGQGAGSGRYTCSDGAFLYSFWAKELTFEKRPQALPALRITTGMPLSELVVSRAAEKAQQLQQ